MSWTELAQTESKRELEKRQAETRAGHNSDQKRLKQLEDCHELLKKECNEKEKKLKVGRINRQKGLEHRSRNRWSKEMSIWSSAVRALSSNGARE